MKKLSVVSVSLMMGALLAGCAAKGDLENVQRDLDEAKTRLFRMEKEMGGFRNETREDVEKNVKALRDELASVRKLEADLQSSIESSKVDMQVLSGKVDDMGNSTKKPAEEIGFIREDMEKRFAANEMRIDKLEKGVDEIQKRLAEAKTRELQQTPDVMYQRALDTFRAGDMAKAREQFTAFLDLNPRHDLAANAHYWLGETYYGDKKYDQAILEFQEVIKNFPGKEKVPAAMLKQGMSFKELGDAKSARYVYRKLVDDFPYSEEAVKAKEKLKELK